MKFKYLILLLILIGCAERPAVVTPNQQRFSHTPEIRIEVEKLINDPFPQTNPSEIQIFVSEKDVEKPFEKIAIIRVKGLYDRTNEKMLFNEARWRAGAIGAQGLIIVDLKGPSNKSLMLAN